MYTGGQSTYRKVHPDWKPSATLDKTDVVSAMEAVEELQPSVKDKSAWRKSNLNVANSTEATKDDARHRHTLPRMNAICVEEDRKGLISSLGERPATDKLTLYICQPSPTITNSTQIGNKNANESEQVVSNKVEIDQDNIETPPATRRIFSPSPVDKREPVQPNPCRRFMDRRSRDSLASPDEPETTVLGDGQFDRFSATRRTRRYKRNAENAEVTSPELVAEKEIIKPNLFNVETSSPVNVDCVADRETRLQVWKERLKGQSEQNGESKGQNRRSRHQTNISQEDVKKALNLNLSSPISISKMTESSNKIDIPNRKTKEHDNDEGFEETQSLMSESPSQGASSGGGNYETDLVDSPQVIVPDFKTKPNSKQDSPTVISKTNRITKPAVNQNQKNNRFDRNTAARQTTQETSKKSVIPRRSASFRKTGSQNNLNGKKVPVQRSGSRNSIVSSRSSLNSATSSSTVKRLPVKSAVAPQKPVQKAPASVKTNAVKRAPSGVAMQKPPRPSLSSFMKPTTSSATKSSVIPSRVQTGFRLKN